MWGVGLEVKEVKSTGDARNSQLFRPKPVEWARGMAHHGTGMLEQELSFLAALGSKNSCCFL